MSEITSFTASLGHNGLIDVFAVGLPGPTSAGRGKAGTKVWHARQKAPDGDWSPWSDAGHPGMGAIDVRSIVDADGHRHVLALAGGGRMWFRERKSDDDFTAPTWQDLGVPQPVSGKNWLFTSICGAIGPSGRIDVAGTAATDNLALRSIFVRPRPAPGASGNPWRQLPENQTALASIYAATTAGGSLDILVPVTARPGPALGMSQALRDSRGAWIDWTSLDPRWGFTGFALSTGSRSHPALDLFGLSGDRIWHSSRDANDWSAFARLPDMTETMLVFGIAAARDADGALHLCAIYEDGTVTHIHQQAAGWSEWKNLDRPDARPDFPDPALILGSDKCLNLLLPRRADKGLVTLRQKTKGGPFVKGPALPALPD